MADYRGTILVNQDTEADDEEQDDVRCGDIRKRLEDDFANAEKCEDKQESDAVVVDAAARDHMCVYLRVRPFSEEEKQKGEDQGCMEIVSEHCLLTHAPEDSHTFKSSIRGTSKATNKFTFSRIFPESTTQKEFFDETMMGTVKEFIDGQNCLIFTYGVTNSGKTYTIQGNANDAGILPRSLDVIFNSICGKQMEDISLKPKCFCEVTRLSPGQSDSEKMIKQSVLKLADMEEPDVTAMLGPSDNDASVMTTSTMSEDSLNRQSMISTASSKHSLDKTSMEDLFEESRLREDATVDVELQGPIKFSVWVSFMEIYNDQIFDLLEPPPKKKSMRRNVLQLKDDKNSVPYVRGLKEVCVNNADEAYKILTIGKKNLQIACTKLNHNSSRSHCVFTVKMLRCVDKDNPKMARMSMLSFCDLAGSERHSKTQSIGERIKEAGNINTSLLTLGRCIKTLRHNQMNKEHPRIVPFRDSKLTRIFQSFFCGKGRASMVVNVNQLASLFDETLHALKYSAIAKHVIVVQEPEKKEPEPEVKRAVKKKRIESLLLEQQSGLSRATVGWATPGTMARVIEEEESAANKPLPDDSGDETGDEEYLDIIEDLKQQLITEKRKNRKLEREIRAEVSAEMAQQLVMIEETYSERLRDAMESAEEIHEKRIELLTKSMRKAPKRKRVADDDDDDFVRGIHQHTAQVKLEEKEEECKKLKEEKGELEKRLKDMMGENQNLQEKFTKLSFENSTLKEQLKEVRSQLKEATGMMEELQALCEETRQQLLASEERLRDRDERILRLETALQEKGCENCQELEDALEQKEEQLTKTQQMVDLMNCELSDKSNKIEELENGRPTPETKPETTETDTQTDADETQVTIIKELENKVTDKENEIKDLLEKISKSDSELKTRQTTIANLEENVAGLNKNLKESEQQKNEMETSVTSLQSQLKSKSDELKRLSSTADLNAAMKERLNCLEEEAEDARNQLVQQKNKHSREVSKLREKLSEVESNLQNKEMDLTQRGTEIFEILEKRTDMEGEITRLTAALDAEQKDKQDTVDALKMLKSKMTSLEQALDEATANSEGNDKLQKQVEELQGSLAEKNKALDSLTKEVGGLRRSLDDVTGMEESLQQANVVVRTKSEEITTLETKLSEKESKIEELTAKCTKLQKDLDSNVAKVTDKLNEGEQWKDKYLAEKEKLKKLSEKLSNMEVEVGMLKAENDKNSSESQSTNNTVKSLKNALAAEKEEHSNDVSELRKNVTEKSAKLDKLQSELFKVRANLENEHKEQLELRSKVHSLESECHCLTRRLQREKEICEESRAQVSKLELKLHESEAKVKDECAKKQELENTVQNLQEQIADLSKKVGELQERVAEGEETEIELQESQVKLEQASQEKERHLATIKDLEAQLNEVKSESGETAAADVEEIENLRCKIKSLQKAIDDAEYKHQMSARQTRREKTQMDKLLKETETAAKEAEDRVTELEAELKEIKDSQGQLIEDKVSQYKTRATKLEDIVRDLEHCLRSSKDSEAKVTAENEEYRAKFKDQQKRLADLDDQLKESQDARDMLAADSAHDLKCVQAILRDKQEQLDETKQEIKTLQDLIDRNAFDYGQQVFEKNERIHQLEEEAEMLRHQADDTQLHDKIHELQEQLSVQTAAAKEGTTKVQRLESQLSVLKTESKESNAKVIVLQKAFDVEKETSQQNENDVKSLQSQVETLTAERENRCAEIQQLKQVLINEKNNSQDLSDKLEKLQSTLKNLQKTDSDKNAQLKLYKENLKDCEEELKKSRAQISNLKSEIEQMRQQYVLGSVVDELRETCVGLRSEVDGLIAKVEYLEDKCALNDKELSAKQDEISRLQAVLREKDEGLVGARERCNDLEETVSRLRTEQEKLQQCKNDEVTSIQAKLDDVNQRTEQISKLQEQIEELERTKTANEREMNALRAESSARESSVQQYNKQIALLKEESQLLNKQLEHSQENESTLRAQLREAQTQMEEQNRKFSQLEDKIRSYDTTIETKTAKLKDLNSEVQSLKSKVDELVAQNKDKESEISKLKNDARKAQDSLELELKALKMDLERKEKRLEIKNRKIEELVEEGEKERRNYEIAYKDSQSNEEVLNNLKTTLEEQEKILDMQDTHIKKKEDDISSLTTKLETVTDKYNALLKESADQTSQLRQLDQMNRKAAKQEQEVTSVQEELRELQNKMKLVESDRARLQTELKCSNNEVRSMEAALSDTRKERESLRRQLESSHNEQDALRKVQDELAEEHKQNERSRGQAEQLRNKFVALEEHNKQLEKEKAHWKDQFNNAEKRKELELNKWREEKDKLVAKIQEVLVEKDKQIKMLKDNGANADQVEVVNLKKQLEDKDAIIAELSTHLENQSAPKTRHARRGKSTRNVQPEEDNAEVYKKEINSLTQQIESLRSEHECEVKTLLLAKDEIISALKDQNKQLEKQIPMKSIPKAVAKVEPISVPEAPVQEENKVIQCDLDDTPTLPQAKEKSTKMRTKRATRGKKRHSSEAEVPVDESDVSEEATTSRKSRGGKRKTSRRTKSVRLEESRDENLQVGMCSIKEEDVVDLSMIHHDQNNSKILHNSTNIGTSLLISSTPKAEMRQATFISPVQSNHLIIPPSTTKKKRRLHKTENLSPFADTPSQSEPSVAPAPDAHQIVKRQLRSRKR